MIFRNNQFRWNKTLTDRNYPDRIQAFPYNENSYRNDLDPRHKDDHYHNSPLFENVIHQCNAHFPLKIQK